MEKRPESRVAADIPVRVWGMDAEGKPFFQSGLANNLSSEGAQLTHLHHCLKVGDMIGIQYGDKKARFKVIWSTPSRGAKKEQGWSSDSAWAIVARGQILPPKLGPRLRNPERTSAVLAGTKCSFRWKSVSRTRAERTCNAAQPI